MLSIYRMDLLSGWAVFVKAAIDTIPRNDYPPTRGLRELQGPSHDHESGFECCARARSDHR